MGRPGAVVQALTSLTTGSVGAQFDPRLLGADCDRCPLQQRVPVPPEVRAGRMLVIGEAPGEEEERRGAPFVGASGIELDRTLRMHGIRREDVSLTNVLLCRPFGQHGLVGYLRRHSAENRRRKARGEEPTLSPLACCAPRLEREVKAAPSLLLLGATALGAMQRIERATDGAATEEGHGEEGLRRVRGYPRRTASGQPYVATVHPAFVLRQRRWTETFRSDVGKAFRHAVGRLQWTGPTVLLDPSLSELDAALARLAQAPYVAVDTETDGLDPESVSLRCVGLASADFGVAAGFASVETPARVWRCPSSLARERIRNFFAAAAGRPRLVGHNVNVYDRPVLERHGAPLPPYRAVFDTVIADHVVESELPHDLAFLASRHTDMSAWKPPGHDAWASDVDLARYCVLDCVVTAQLAPVYVERLAALGQAHVYRSDVGLQRLCVGMHRAGMAIDEGERRRHASRLWRRMQVLESEAVALAGRPVNLRSPKQVAVLLYEDWGLPVPVRTDTGDPSTDRDALYELLFHALPEPQTRFVERLADYRAVARTLAKDVLKIGETPDWLSELVADSGADDALLHRERRAGLRVGPDGRVHPFWHPHTVPTGRLSCGDPQVHNVPHTKRDPDSIRSIYRASPGCALVACDLEQAEFRIVALLSGDRTWLDAFQRSDVDVHLLNAAVFLGTTPDRVSSQERDFGKNLTYGSFYGGEADVLLAQLRQVRLSDGTRPYARVPRRFVEEPHGRLLRAHPALPRWWRRVQEEFLTTRQVRDPVLGRIRRFLDAGETDGHAVRNEMINHPVQAAIGGLMGGAFIVGDAMREVGWPWDSESVGRGLGGPGLLHHGHDSLMVEVAEGRAEEAAARLRRIMTREVHHEGRCVTIPAKAKIGRRWSEV